MDSRSLLLPVTGKVESQSTFRCCARFRKMLFLVRGAYDVAPRTIPSPRLCVKKVSIEDSCTATSGAKLAGLAQLHVLYFYTSDLARFQSDGAESCALEKRLWLNLDKLLDCLKYSEQHPGRDSRWWL